MTTITVENKVTVVELGGSYESLDETSLVKIRDLLLEQATLADPPRLVVDLSQTRFIGSSFLEALFRAWNRLKSRHGHFALCGLSPLCAEVLRVSKLETIWEIFPTRADAVAALGAR